MSPFARRRSSSYKTLSIRGSTLNRLLTTCAVLTALAAVPARADEEPEKLEVLLLPLTPKGASEALTATLDDILATRARRNPGYQIVTLADLNTILESERLRDLSGCDEVACSSEIAGAIDADRVLAGSLGILGTDFVLSLRWIDPSLGATLGDVVERAENEEAIPAAIDRALATLLGGSSAADAATRARKKPTFWTFEVGVGTGTRRGAEPYDGSLGGTLRLAWGGRQKGSSLFYNLAFGFGLDRYWGDSRGHGGVIRYWRADLDPFLELRAALGLGRARAVRVYGMLGGGLDFTWHHAREDAGTKSDGSAIFPELRLGAGLWYRFSETSSLFGGYRFRYLWAGDGADGASELIALGSTPRSWTTHDVELGWAVHF
jgi:hypothetical protein